MKQVQPRNAKEQRRQNSNLIIRIIQAKGPITRQQIASYSGLSIPSVTNIVSYLNDLQLLKAISVTGKNGKPVPAFTLDGSRYAALGLEFLRRHIYCVATDLSGNVLGRITIDHVNDDYEMVLADVATQLRALRTEVEGRGFETIGLGIAAPGPIDEGARRLTNAYGFHDWSSMPLADDFERLLELPALLEKDSDLSALAEFLLGSANERGSLIYARLEEGVGAAVIDRGRLLGGAERLHSSLGHITIVVNGEQCECGNRGCLEVYTRQSRIESRLASCCSAQERESVIDEVAEYIAVGVANLVVLFGMELIVIDGESLNIDDRMFDKIRERIPPHAFPVLSRDLDIRRGVVGLGSAAIGAALSVAQAVMAEPETLRARPASGLHWRLSNLTI